MKNNTPEILFLLVLIGVLAATVNGAALELNSDDAEMSQSVGATNTGELNEKNTRGSKDPNDYLPEAVLPDNNILYPDLVLADPDQVVILTGENTRNLQFNTAFANLGEGDLYLYSIYKDDGYNATQVLYTSTGQEYNVNIGEFQYKEEHEHWHLENFANYELWSYDDNGERDELLSSTIKVSFCIWDFGEYTEYNFDALSEEIQVKERQFPECNYDFQGLTVGWYDEYDAFTFGQSIDILNIPDGKYILRTTINVDRDVIESNYDNNESNIYIEIYRNTVTILETA